MIAASAWSAAAPDVLKRHGSSFHWAGKLLAPGVRAGCARLYAICRALDDLADRPTTAAGQDAAESRLRELMTAIRERDTAEPLVAEADALFATDQVAWVALEQLAAAAHNDVGPVRISDEAELRGYAHGVAGTVGIMMASILGAQDGSDTRAAARELGIAMQYTNIARDVLEDAGRDRLYLPARWLGPGVTPAALVAGDAHARATAWQAVQHLLARADIAYASAWRGLPALPPPLAAEHRRCRPRIPPYRNPDPRAGR